MKKKEMIQELKGDITELKELVSSLNNEIFQLKCIINGLNVNYPVYVPQLIEPIKPYYDSPVWVADESTTAVNYENWQMEIT